MSAYVASSVFGIALCGLGRMGSIHARNCIANPRIDLKYIVEVDCEKAKEFCKENGLHSTKVIHSSEFDSVLGDVGLAGVIIATVTHTHEQLILRSLAAKKPVLCEKPLASTYDATVACYDAAVKEGIPLLCAFNRRFDPTHRSVHEGVHAGKIGQVQVVKTCSRDSPLPSLDYIRISGGLFRDCAIHDIDMVMWMLDDQPQSVCAQGHAFIPDYAGSVGDIDTLAITMKMRKGALALIDISRLATYGYDQRIEVFGSQGMLQSDNIPRTAAVTSNADGVSRETHLHSFPTRFADAYINELVHFVDVIGGKAQLLVTRESTLRALQVTLACQRSYETGQIVTME